MSGQRRAFRLITELDKQAAKATGLIPLVSVDRSDGFVHLSPHGQVLKTAGLYFPPGTQLYALEFDPLVLGPDLKWEPVPERDDEFPHLYKLELRWEQACRLHKIEWSADGQPSWGNAHSTK